MTNIDEVRDALLARIAATDDPRTILRAPELKQLYTVLPTLAPEERGAYGKAVNEL